MIKLGNPAEALGGLILRYGIAGRPISVYVAYAGATATGDVLSLFEGVGGDSTVDDGEVTISAVIDSIEAQFSPRKRINASAGVTVLLPTGTKIQLGQTIFILER